MLAGSQPWQHLPHLLSFLGTSRAREGVQRSCQRGLIAKPLLNPQAAAWCKTCARHARIRSKGPTPSLLPRQSLQLCPLGELQETCKLPRYCTDPRKRKPHYSLGCGIINTSPAHAHCNLRMAPGHNRAHCACAVRLPLRTQDKKKGSPGSTKKKFGAKKLLVPRFLPRGVS